ncbi:helix-turn-helix transcriptional regulator (plasmid) [Paracidovorax citrulli]|nr:helix-turn-helix transcriptional regulator [Paracidovorax citrulli]
MTAQGQRVAVGPAANPEPSDILAGREAAGLTQSQAAALVHGSLRTWQRWEAGDRPASRRRSLSSPKLVGRYSIDSS